jgi:hypothetical protein
MRRILTPPEIARRYGVATAKVRRWIENGELAALNLASGSSTRPRYGVTPEALQAFELARTVTPNGSGESTRGLRHRRATNIKKFF